MTSDRQAATATTPASDPSQHGLQRNAIGLVQSTVIGVASSAPGQAMAVSIGALIVASAYGGAVAVVLMTLPMLAIAYSYHRLNMWEQNCGASYVWVGRAISPYLGFLVGWIMLAGYVLGTASDIFPIGPSLLGLIGADTSSRWGEVLSGTILAGGVTVMAVYGIQLTARFQMLIAGIEYVILLAFCGIGLYTEFISQPAGTVHPSWGWLNPSGVGGHGSLVASALVAVYLFAGWDASIYLNEETERPERNPGKAVIMAVLILGAFYSLMVLSFQGAAPASEIGAHSDAALGYIAHTLVGSPWDKLMSFAVVLSILGTTQAFLVVTARIAYAMGSDRVLPPVFGRVSPKYRTPVFGTVLFGTLAVAMLWIYVFSSSVGDAFATVVGTAGVLYALFYAFTGIATSWYHRRLLARSPKDALTVGVLPLCAAAVLVWVAVKSIADFDGTAMSTIVVIGITGLLMMVVAAAVYRSPFFKLRRVAYDPRTGDGIERGLS